MSRRRSPPRRPPSRGCSRRSSAQFAGKVHSSSCYCYYYHMAATSIPTLERRLRELLREHSVTRGDFTLASGRRSTFYIDARRTTMSGEGLVVIGALGLARLTARGWAPDLVGGRSEEHTSELQSRSDLVCRLLLEKKKKTKLYHGIMCPIV